MEHAQQPTASLLDRLRQCAQAWVDADERRTLARLGREAINDGGFFDNLDKRVKGPTTDTLERFAAHLADPAQWPGGMVPLKVVDFAHAVGVSAAAAVPSSGKRGDVSPATEGSAPNAA